MAGVIRYLILANFFLIIFALFYHLVISTETRFKTNRIVFLSGVLVSLVLPLFNFNWFPSGSYSILSIPEIIVSAKSRMTHYNLAEIQIYGNAPFVFPWIKFVIGIYITGAALTAGLLIWKIKRIQYWTGKYPMKWFKNLYITLIPENWNPFSFLGIVYYPQPFSKNDQKTNLVLEHEYVHIKQKHSWDILFIEIVKIIFFYNPAIYTIKKQIQINHEYLADSSVVGDNHRHYSQELIRSQFQVPDFQLINQFNQTSFLKRRLLMLMKTKTNQTSFFKYLLLLPLVASLLWISACTEEETQGTAGMEQEIKAAELKNAGYKSVNEHYAQIIIDADYENMTEAEKKIKVVAAEMLKTGASEEDVLKFAANRVKSLATRDKDAIENSTLFKSAGLNISDIEVNVLNLKAGDMGSGTENGEVFYIVEEMPEFDGGGLEEFRNWVNENVNYPDIALQNGIKGTVYVSFIIDKEGKVGSIQIVRGVDPSLDNEVKRVLNSSPDWTPGVQRGQKVQVQMAIPVKFALQ